MDGSLSPLLPLEAVEAGARLEVRRKVVTNEVEHHELPPGCTIAEALAAIGWPPELTRWTVVVIEGHEIAVQYWHVVRPRPGRRILVAIRPAGGGGGSTGKTVLRLVATIAIAIAAFYLAPVVGPLIGITSKIGIQLIGAGLTMLGTMAVGALIGTPKMSSGGSPYSNPSGPAESQSYGLSGAENSATPYAPVPRLYGRHRMTPPIAAETFVLYDGAAQTLFALLDFGYGPLDVSDIRIGDTPITSFPTAQWIVHHAFVAGDALQLYVHDQAVLPVGAALGQNVDNIRVAPQAGQQINIDVLFPAGLVRIDDQGDRQTMLCHIQVNYRIAGSAEAWRPVTDARAGAGILFNGGTAIGASQAQQIGLITNDPGHSIFTSQPPRYYRWMPSDGGVAVGNQVFFVNFNHWAFITSVVDSSTGGIPPPGGKLIGIDSQPPGLAFSADSGPIQIWKPAAGGTIQGVFSAGFVPGSPSVVEFSGATSQARAATIYINSPENVVWEVWLRRLSPNSSDPRVSDAMSWQNLRIAAPAPAVAPRVPHTIMELRVTASEEISGQISRINALCTSYLTTYDGASFGYGMSRNPAWIYADVLHGIAATKRIVNIDWAKLKVWADYCDSTSAQGDTRCTCDMIVDSRVTVSDLAQSICTTGRAAPTIRDGSYSVITEAETRVPVQLFTAINAINFQAAHVWVDEPHALNVRYLSEETWQRGELQVFADGYDVYTATKFETLELIGVTRPYQAWRAGRYYLAAGRLRKETMEIDADIESIVCQRGDLVLVQHDRLIGGDMARVAVVISPTQLALDFPYDPPPPNSGLVIRRLAGGISGSIGIAAYDAVTGIFTSNPGQTFDAVVGDLAVIGQFTQETTDWIVDSIVPGPDLTAKLRLIEARPEILDADSGPIPPYVPPSISGGILQPLPAVPWVQLTKQEVYRNRIPFYDITLNWGAPNYAVVRYELYEFLAGEWRKFGETVGTHYYFSFDRTRLPRYGGEVHTYGVRGISALGRFGPIASAADTLVADTTAPPALTLSSNVLDQHILLSWLPPDPVLVPDIARFEIRWSPRTDAVVWGQMNVVTTAAFDATTVTVNAITGMFAVAAIDTSQNTGDPAYALILVETLADIDIIQEVRAAPGWAGRFDRTRLVSGELQLTKQTDGTFEPEGWFYSTAIVLFPEPWKLRLFQHMDAYGYAPSQVISTWVPMAMAIPLDSSALTHDWDAQIWIARRDAGITLNNTWYSPLAHAVPWAGPAGSFEPFSNLFVTDIEVARVEWAIRLTTKQPNVTPSVINAGLTVDHRERREWDDDVTIAAGGATVNFDFPFFATPALAVTLNNGAAGDRSVRTVDRTAFHIQFFTSAGASVARSIDWQAIGYGKGV